MLGKVLTSSRGLAQIRSHLETAWKPVSTRSGCALFRMMAAMAARSLSLDGADGISEYGAPGLIKGTQGHLHGSVGFGPNGIVPSVMRMPGQPANRHSGDSWRSSALTGKRSMWYLRMTPLRPLEVPSIWHTMQAQKSPMPRRRHSSPRTTLLSMSWTLCWIMDEGTRPDHSPPCSNLRMRYCNTGKVRKIKHGLLTSLTLPVTLKVLGKVLNATPV
jgi:hypothetical protein